jgi:hypothetical protein
LCTTPFLGYQKVRCFQDLTGFRNLSGQEILYKERRKNMSVTLTVSEEIARHLNQLLLGENLSEFGFGSLSGFSQSTEPTVLY